jgi:hypothetical protein
MITEVKQALGSWSIRLRSHTPRELMDGLTYFGHIAVLPGRVDVEVMGDGLLSAARYVGVYRARFNQDAIDTPVEYEIKGVSMAFWLGDEDHKGAVFETAKSFSGSTFAQVVAQLYPSSGAVTPGIIGSGASGTYTGEFQWVTPRWALDYITETFTQDSADPMEWRVSNTGVLDVAKASALYPSVAAPTALLVRKGGGREMTTVGLQGDLSLDSDIEDYTTRVVLLGEGEGKAIAVGTANGPATTYKDLFGNPVKLTRVINDPEATAKIVDTRAGVELNKYDTQRRASQISTGEYDVRGTFGAGDTIMVFNPDAGFVDTNNETYWQGAPINPIHLRVTELEWGIPPNWTVAFRDIDGKWLDFSDYYAPEAGATRITVGEFLERLGGANFEPFSGRHVGDITVPATPVFGAFSTAAYESSSDGITRAQIRITWTAPTNADGTTILDGSHYEIRYRPDTTIAYPATWNEANTKNWNQVFTWDQPLTPPIVGVQWQTVFVGFDVTNFILQELTPGVQYEFQIRAIDTASPPNLSAWSSTATFQANRDFVPPAQPAPPEIASSRVAIQVTHRLGAASGGNYNLASDLDHLEIHVGGESFAPSNVTQIGKVRANAAMMQAETPAVATFPIEQIGPVYVRVVAVDRSGNRSNASSGASSTALLMDDAHISDLTVSKVTAGELKAAVILSGSIKTAETGARAELTPAGLELFNSVGQKTVQLDATTGDAVLTGTYKTNYSGQRIEITDAEPYSTIYFYPSYVNDPPAFINAVDYVSREIRFTGIGINTSPFIGASAPGLYNRIYMTDAIRIQTVNASQAQSGGLLYIDELRVLAQYEAPSGIRGGFMEAQATQLQIGFDDGDSGPNYFLFGDADTYFIGRWPNFIDLGATQGLDCGNVSGTSSASSLTVSWGVTRATPCYPIVAIRDNQAGAAIRGFQIGANDTTSWLVELSGAANGAWSVYYWAFRTG